MADIIDIKDFYNHETRISIVENAIISIDRRFDQIERRFEQMDRRFERLEDKLDRLYWMILGLYGSGFLFFFGYFLKSKGWI